MKYFEIEGAFLIVPPKACLHLTDAQAAARKAKLKTIKGEATMFETTLPATFKKGETFGCDQALARTGQAKELKMSAGQFEARIRKERDALAEWRKGELDKRAARARAVEAAAQKRAAARSAAGVDKGAGLFPA